MFSSPKSRALQPPDDGTFGPGAMIETDRLILRPPIEQDREQIAAIHSDPRVGEWLSGALARAESDAIVDRILAQFARDGFSYWAAARKVDQALVGLVGLVRCLPSFRRLQPWRSAGVYRPISGAKAMHPKLHAPSQRGGSPIPTRLNCWR